MNIQLAAFVFGCLLLLVAIVGGGFEVKELKVPKVGRASRLASCVFGLLFVVLGFTPAFAGILPGSQAESHPQPTALAAVQSAPTVQTAQTPEPLSASLSTQAPPAEARPAAEPPEEPHVSQPTRPRKRQTTTSQEPQKPSLRKKAQKKAKDVWRRVW